MGANLLKEIVHLTRSFCAPVDRCRLASNVTQFENKQVKRDNRSTCSHISIGHIAPQHCQNVSSLGETDAQVGQSFLRWRRKISRHTRLVVRQAAQRLRLAVKTMGCTKQMCASATIFLFYALSTNTRYAGHCLTRTIT